MFKKLVSGLPFSPALVGQLGFYARRLKKEEASRRLGLVFTALALVIQSFAVLSPPDPANAANAASASDLIWGGVTSVSAILSAYDNPTKDYKKIMDYVGITRDEIKAMRDASINSKEYGTSDGTWLSWGRVSRFSPADGEVQHDINGTIVYSRPLWKYDSTSWTIPNGSTYPAFRGYSAKMGEFAIMKGCGNVVTRKLPVVEIKYVTVCRPGTGVITIKESDKLSTDLAADNIACQPKDITVCRPGTGVITIKESEKLATDLPADSDFCKPKPEPIATCSSLSEPRKIERTKFSVNATAVAQNGAVINKYSFVVKKKDTSGAIVLTKDVASTATSVDNVILEVKDAGDYYVQVFVSASSSANPLTSADCAKTFTVLPPEKCAVNPDLLATDKECQPCPGNTALWYKDPDCAEKVASSKEATNLTQNSQTANKVTANGSDRIQFTLTMYNIGKVLSAVDFKENLSDVLEYSTMYDNGGGAIVNENGTSYLNWGKISLKPGEKVSRTFTVKVHDTIPLTARGTSDPSSYDCIMTNTFGNTVNINMNCPTPKVIERVVEQLPNTGPTENIIFSGIVLSIVMFFYARSRQLGAEVRLIRKDFNAGAL